MDIMSILLKLVERDAASVEKVKYRFLIDCLTLLLIF